MTTRTAPPAAAMPEREQLLRRTLLANALFCEITGLALLLASAGIARFLGIAPHWPLLPIGAGLVLFALQVFLVARSRPLDRRGARVVIGLDLAWVAASATLLLSGRPPLASGGVWAVLLAADAVAVFALLQILGLRRAAG